VTAPTLIRARFDGERTTLRLLMKHEMESGQRKDGAGRPVAAWHIQGLSVRLNGRTVLSAQWGPSIAKDPFLQIVLKDARPGDTVAVSWTDNRGESRSDEARVSAA
jgi:sulfur-oxidizing protein SoxZ